MPAKKPHVKPVSATAVVTLTVQVRCTDSWGTDCSVEQVHRQASESAIGYLRHLVAKGGTGDHRLAIIGDPSVKSVITSNKD